MELQLTSCPECGRPAEVIDRFTLPSTDGPIEHVKTRCITGPWFVTPAGYHAPAAAATPHRDPTAVATSQGERRRRKRD
jgi:hypothetical protein